MLKSIAVVVGSYLLSVVLVMCTDPVLSRMFPGDFVRGRMPSDKALITSTALFFVISIFCVWVCARLAPANPGKHVLWFFVVGEAMGVVATMANWSKSFPHWYLLSWLVAWPVACWIGLMLAGRQASRVAA
jgi:hypothetical protein